MAKKIKKKLPAKRKLVKKSKRIVKKKPVKKSVTKRAVRKIVKKAKALPGISRETYEYFMAKIAAI